MHKRRVVLAISLVLVMILISGCGEVQTFKNLTYQQSFVIDGRGDDSTPFNIYIFQDLDAKDIQMYDFKDSSYKELLEVNQLYDVTVSVGSRFTMSNYIKGIKKSE